MQKARGNYCIIHPEDNDMMDTVELKNSGGKIVPHSDLRAGTNATKYSLKEKNKVRKRRIGTWNVRSLGICGKLENLKIEMERLKIDIIGISELKWTGKGDFWSEDYRIIFSGDDHRVTGVGFILNKEIGKKVVEVVQYNERIIAIKIETKPVDTFILQVYMPTSTHKDEEIEEIYEQINEVIEMTNEKTNLIVLGDWNAIVGESKEHGVTGAFGLGKRNERGHRLIEFCKERNLVITNTMFSQPIRRRYTWTMPGGRARYQIDYILVRNRYKNQVKKCKTYPGADINSDHNLVLMETNLSLKRKKPNESTKRKWCIDKLKNEEIRSDFNEEINNLLQEANSNKNQENDKVEWEKLRDTITKAAEKHLKLTKEMPTKPWINNEIIDLIEKRRKYKNAVSEEGIAEYKKYRNLVNREAKKAKEEWLNNICKDIDSCLTKGLSDKAYKNIKRFFREFKDKTTILRGTDGKIITEGKKKLEVWKQYIEKLYGNDNINAGQWAIEEEDAEQENIGQPILKEEFETALNELKHNKATGIDNISGEMLKALEGQGKEILFKIIYDAYEKGLVPKDFEKCLMIALPKKKKSEKCEDHRTISLITHASKILTKIIHKRIEVNISVNLEEDQFGFRRNRGTREAILCLRMIMEKMYRVNRPMYIAFIDLEKAFDNVNWEILFNIMKTINIDIKDRRIIHKLYLNEKAVITDKRSRSWEEANIEKGVRQGCNLSPTLFNLYIENTLKQLREDEIGGIKINGMLVQMLRFADDIALIAESEEALGKMLTKMNDSCKEYKMKINKSKTKILICSKQELLSNIEIENEKLETVQCFTYLGSKITHDGRSEIDIKSRIAQAKQAFYKKKHLLTANTVSLNTRKNLIKSFVWSIALYGAETWTILKAERKKIEAFETWCWRRALKIAWTEKVRNEEVYLRMNEQKAIWKTIKERRKKWIGHIMRNNEWITTIIEGKIEGKAGRGRPRTPFMKQIIDDIGKTNYKELKVAVMDRDKWRAIKVI